MLLLSLDPDSPTPAYLQIRDGIATLVDEGALAPGDRLPPSRDLAQTVGVHRSTVVRAYGELRALGYLESRPGSYSTVRHRARLPATATGSQDGSSSLVDWGRRATETHPDADLRTGSGHPHPQSASPRDRGIDFERLAADPRLTPTDTLRRCARAALLRDGAGALDYADPAGWRPLRETIASRLRAHGVAVSPDEVLVTGGAQQAIDLILRLLTRAGDRVVVEAPTYGMAHALLRLHGLVPIEIPMGEDGMDLDALEQALGKASPKLLYTMPNFHNPTGTTTDQAHRERLLGLCERARVPIVEDGFQEEMKYFGRSVLPIKSIDARGIVLYVGTFSKVVFPGLRVGWIAAPRDATALLTGIQHASSLSANTLAQAIAERFCRHGELEAYLRRLHRIYRSRMQTMLDGLAAHMPTTARWTRPLGGYTLWLTLPGPPEAEPAWHERIEAAGVRVAPGSRFFAERPAQPHFRLSIACVDDDAIREGCRRLGAVAKEAAPDATGRGDGAALAPRRGSLVV